MQGMVKMAVFAVGWLLLFMVHPAMLQFIDEGEGEGGGTSHVHVDEYWWWQLGGLVVHTPCKHSSRVVMGSPGCVLVICWPLVLV